MMNKRGGEDIDLLQFYKIGRASRVQEKHQVDLKIRNFFVTWIQFYKYFTIHLYFWVSIFYINTPYAFYNCIFNK